MRLLQSVCNFLNELAESPSLALLALCSDNPCIMDYIRLKHDVSELEKHFADWKRKIEILAMERQRTRQVLKSVATIQGPAGTTGSLSATGPRK